MYVCMYVYTDVHKIYIHAINTYVYISFYLYILNVWHSLLNIKINNFNKTDILIKKKKKKKITIKVFS